MSCCVPNLEFDGLSVELDGSDLEVHADGGNVTLRVRVVRESQEEARLSNAGITDQKQFEQIITEKIKDQLRVQFKELKSF